MVRGCLSFLKPNFNNMTGDSWEELDAGELIQGAQSLRWLVWVMLFLLLLFFICNSFMTCHT